MILDKEITVIDNFIDKEYQEEIKQILIGNKPFLYENEEFDFDWYFVTCRFFSIIYTKLIAIFIVYFCYFFSNTHLEN